MIKDPALWLESLYREQGARLWRAVALYAGDREVASDAVSEAFAQAARRGTSLRDPAAWIWRVSFKIAAAELKNRRRTLPLSEVPYEAPEPLRELMEALGLLSSRQRESVILHYYAGYTLEEIASILGSSKSAVGVHLHRARARLRALLEEDDG